MTTTILFWFQTATLVTELTESARRAESAEEAHRAAMTYVQEVVAARDVLEEAEIVANSEVQAAQW
jgi:hypothetical protein